MNAPDHSQLGLPDYLIIAGFFVVMLGIGAYFYGRMKDMKDYFSGGRQVPWWLSGVSFYMTTFSAFAFVSYSQMAYEHGWVSIGLFWCCVPAGTLSAILFARAWRRAASASPLDFIEMRYGRTMRQLLVWLNIPLRVIDDGLKLFAIGTIVSVGLNVEMGWAIFASGTIMLLYTFMGGLWAVLITDFVQFVVMLAAVIILPVLAYHRVGGLEAFFAGIPEGQFAWTTERYDGVYYVQWFALLFLNYSTSWSLVQRYYSVRSDAEARKVGYLCAALNVVGPVLFFFPAMAAAVFMPDVADTSQIYALLCIELLPIGMMGLLIAAMFSATMSMLSSDYNAMASVLTNDVYKRVFHPTASDWLLVQVGRIATLLVGVVALAIAFVVLTHQEDKGLFDLMVSVFSVFLPPVAIPMLVGLMTARTSNLGGLMGLGLGGLVGLTAFVLGADSAYADLRKPHIMMPLTSAATLIGLVVGTLIQPHSREQADAVGRFNERVRRKGVVEDDDVKTRPAQDFSPVGVIGVAVAALGAMTAAVMVPSVVREIGALVAGEGVSVLAASDSSPWWYGLLTFGVGLALTLVGSACWWFAPGKSSRP